MQEEEPGLLWPPSSQGVQASLAPVLKVLAGHVLTPVRSTFATVPTPAVWQEEAPGGEYSPGLLQGVQEVPSVDFVPAAQLMVLVRRSLGMVPGSAEEQ